ncbi:amidohydrolase [Microbacterium invictum]|uniref:Amidohydrolase family protein n=1 Tax=Microbacterium invictum TaxID=515415 RepID=A0ABZ0V7R2_9MICO|nr:amidohydrolase family protein [Microbacterium invictum]WQB68822.1 amidohydrolase family protein [Microbacterium invictum]
MNVGEHVAVIRGARVRGPGRALLPVVDDGDRVDVFLADGAIVDIAPSGVVRPVGPVLEADGRFLIPGLWDHHVHVTQWALAAERVSVVDATTAVEAARRLAQAPVLGDGRRVGVGFRDALWPDRPSVALLDAHTGDVPTYLINADVHSVWLNSAALRRESLSADDSGILREAPAFEVSRRLNAVPAAHADDLVERMARRAAARGVVGLVDLDMAWNEEAWTRRAERGFDTLRVSFGIYPEHLDRAIAQGLRTGDPLGGDSDLLRVGPLKVITDGSLGTRTAACSHPYAGSADDRGLLTVQPGELVEMMTRATAAGLSCAIHAIGDVANSHALDAFALTGATGTIEHAQLVGASDIPRFARLGVGASVQPEHAVDDRDMTDEIWAAQTATPYPLRALADAGATLLFGSDAPVSPLDPWAALAAAVHRTRGGRPAWRPEQALDPETALAASTRGGSTDPTAVRPGAPADLVLCETDPLVASESEMRGMSVKATLLAGRLTHLG